MTKENKNFNDMKNIYYGKKPKNIKRTIIFIMGKKRNKIRYRILCNAMEGTKGINGYQSLIHIDET